MLRGMIRKARRRSLALANDPGARMKLTAPLLHPYWRFRFHSFGSRSIVARPYLLAGPHRISVGDDAILFGVWLEVRREAWGRADPPLQIGNRVVVAPFGRILAAESVVLEDHVAIATGCLVIDFEHTKGGSWDSFGQGPIETSPVRIGRGTALGERVTVLKGSNIGRSCFIGAHSLVRGEIPDYSIAAGVPARVIGRTRDA